MCINLCFLFADFLEIQLKFALHLDGNLAILVTLMEAENILLSSFDFTPVSVTFSWYHVHQDDNFKVIQLKSVQTSSNCLSVFLHFHCIHF